MGARPVEGCGFAAVDDEAQATLRYAGDGGDGVLRKSGCDPSCFGFLPDVAVMVGAQAVEVPFTDFLGVKRPGYVIGRDVEVAGERTYKGGAYWNTRLGEGGCQIGFVFEGVSELLAIEV